MAGWIRKTDSGTYQARYRTPHGRTRSKTYRRRVDAERWLRQELAQIDRGDWVDPAAGAITFADWSEQWAATRVHIRASTRERDDTYLRTLVVPHLGSRNLNALTRRDLQDWVNELSARGYAPATIQIAHGLVSMALNAAVDARLIHHSPTRGVNLPRRTPTEKRFLTMAELHDLADAIDPRYRSLVLTAGLTGARFGELAALRNRDLDLQRSRLTITRSLVEVKGVATETEPKTPAAKRTIALPQALVDDLTEATGNHGRDDFVFPSPEGGPLRRRGFRQRFWLPAVGASVGEPCRFHDLRHTHAALLISVNTHPKLVQARLGHASITTTLDVYGHLYDPLDAAAANQLEQLIAETTAREPRAIDERGL